MNQQVSSTNFPQEGLVVVRKPTRLEQDEMRTGVAEGDHKMNIDVCDVATIIKINTRTNTHRTPFHTTQNNPGILSRNNPQQSSQEIQSIRGPKTG